LTDFSGVLIGTVEDRDDPDHQGRILVSFETFSGRLESYWAPIAAPMAGGSRGFRFAPELGDECLVAFDRSDPDHPYVVGFLHNGVDAPPSDDPQERVIASVNGHRITFRDPDPSNGNKGSLVIQDAHGTRIEMTNGHTRVTALGQLDIKADVLTIQGRPVVPGAGSI
jgi:uncharacterized protein involved in type VI secretion and phage assembly